MSKGLGENSNGAAPVQSLMQPDVLHCPFAFYEKLRKDAPVYFMEDTGAYIVTRYDLCMEVLKNPQIYSSMAVGRRAGISCPEADRIIAEEGYGHHMPTIVNNDPPGHTAFRALVNDAFRAGRVRQMEDYIGEICTMLVKQFAAQPEVEAVHEFAVPLPMYVIADQLGVPRHEFRRFKEWSDAWVIGLGLPVPDEDLIKAARLVVEMQHFMIARMHERRAQPEDDMLSDLVQAELPGAGCKMTDKEVLSIVEQLLVAGNETTTNGIAHALHQLVVNMALQERLRASEDPKQVQRYIEEVLRYESPVQGLFRWTKQATELAGVHIPKDSVVMVRYAAGNRDDAKFDRPEVLDIDRKNAGAHIAFGSGIHHCVGSQLARAEMLAAVRTFLHHFSRFELACDPSEIRYHASFALRGPTTLPLKLTRA